MDERHVVHVLGHVRQHRRNLLAAFARRRERPGGPHQVAVLPLERNFPFRTRQRRAVELFESRLVIPQIDVRCRAGAEDLQDPLRFGLLSKSRFGDARRSGRDGVRQQLRERNARQAGRHLRQEAAAGRRVFESRHREGRFVFGRTLPRSFNAKVQRSQWRKGNTHESHEDEVSKCEAWRIQTLGLSRASNVAQQFRIPDPILSSFAPLRSLQLCVNPCGVNDSPRLPIRCLLPRNTHSTKISSFKFSTARQKTVAPCFSISADAASCSRCDGGRCSAIS